MLGLPGTSPLATATATATLVDAVTDLYPTTGRVNWPTTLADDTYP